MTDLATLEAQLAAWNTALIKCAAGQSYSISTGTVSRSLTRANLKEIRETIASLEQRIAEAKRRGRGGRRLFHVS